MLRVGESQLIGFSHQQLISILRTLEELLFLMNVKRWYEQLQYVPIVQLN